MEFLKDFVIRAIRKCLGRYVVFVEFHWPASGDSFTYGIRRMRRDELICLIWVLYGAKVHSDQIKEILEKMLGTGQARDMATVRAAVKHCEGVVDRADESWGTQISTLIQ